MSYETMPAFLAHLLTVVCLSALIVDAGSQVSSTCETETMIPAAVAETQQNASPPMSAQTTFRRAKRGDSYNPVDLTDPRYDATCRLQFYAKSPGKLSMFKTINHCSCAFYGPHSVVAAAHCFIVASKAVQMDGGADWTLQARVIPRYNSAPGDKAAKDEDNKKRAINVVE